MSILPRAEILLGGFAYSLEKWITFTGQAATVTNDAYFAYAMRHGRDNPVTNTATVKPGDETMTQSKPLTIRPATPADVDEVTRIYIDSWNAGYGELLSRADRTVTPDLVERWSHDLARPAPHRWWVAERMGSIVGVVGIGPSRDPVDPQLGELYTIAVDTPHWNREGIDITRYPIPGVGRIQRGDSVDGGMLPAGYRILRSHGVAARRRGPRRGATDTLQAKFGYVGLRLRRTREKSTAQITMNGPWRSCREHAYQR